MPHPADNNNHTNENGEYDNNNEPFSSPCGAPPLEPIQEHQGQAEPAPQPALATENPVQPSDTPAPENPAPATENIVPLNAMPENPVFQLPTVSNPMPQLEALQKTFERQAEDSFRTAVGSTTEAASGFYSAATESYESVSEAMRASAESFTTALTQLNWKLFEFGRLNAQSSMDYVREVSSVRNVRDLVDVQTAYVRAQHDALTSQLRELQTLTTDLAGKTAAPFKEQIALATRLPRIG